MNVLEIPKWLPQIEGLDPEIEYHSDGVTIRKATYTLSDGKCWRVWNKNGLLRDEEWVSSYRTLHREDGPAARYWDEQGILRDEKWVLSSAGGLHRMDGPAQSIYYPSGHLYREIWYQNGKLHREDGPAVICYNPDGSVISEEYYIKDRELSRAAFEQMDHQP